MSRSLPILARYAGLRCRACNGDFTARGMLGIVSCHCRMPDAGKPCTDGDQCQGVCVSTSIPDRAPTTRVP